MLATCERRYPLVQLPQAKASWGPRAPMETTHTGVVTTPGLGSSGQRWFQIRHAGSGIEPCILTFPNTSVPYSGSR